jgi:hypothetical protein
MYLACVVQIWKIWKSFEFKMRILFDENCFLTGWFYNFQWKKNVFESFVVCESVVFVCVFMSEKVMVVSGVWSKSLDKVLVGFVKIKNKLID